MLKNIIKKLVTFIKCRINGVESGVSCDIGYDVKIVKSCKLKKGGVRLGDDVIIRPGCKMYTSKSNGIYIGSSTEIGEYSTISAYNSIFIEKEVLTGPHIFISDHNHNYMNPYKPIYKQGIMAVPNSKIIIGEGAWIGTNAVIVGNIRVGKHCVIGANSVVTKDIPDYSVAVGIPAKVIKRYNFEKQTWEKVVQ